MVWSRLAVVAGCFLLAGGVSTVAACEDIEHAGANYTVCTFDPHTDSIRIFDRDPITGQFFGSFANLSSSLWGRGLFTRFAMNGGMYHRNLSPVGLYVEYGRELKRISTGFGWGNFHLKPNGVFYLQGDKAGVLETDAYVKSGIKPDFATQSGPMLLIDGNVHPRFLPESDSLNRRNGVGVSDDGKVHFVIVDALVRFYDFATLFRDKLNVKNALYLDGSISSVEIPERNRRDDHSPLGPIIAVVEKMP